MHRVLLVAEACNPEWVSVPLVGWSLTRAIAARTDAHVVTQVRNAAAFDRAGLKAGRDYTAIDTESVAGPVWKLGERLRGGTGKGWTTLTALSSLMNYEFERRVWATFGREILRGRFDVVHRVTPVSPTVPSLLATDCRRAGVPFVAGPWNGGVPWPTGFDAARRREREWLSYLRGANKLLPGYRSTRRDASALLIGSIDTWKLEPPEAQRKAFYLPENAIDPARFPPRPPLRPKPPGAAVRVVFVGRLVPYKGADMLLEAAAPMIRAGTLVLKIIGDGPQMGHLRELIIREQLSDGVELVGWVEHAKVQDHLVHADLFAFPSIREFGGAVALEGMAVGLVPMVVRYGGLGELVTDKTGFLIDMSDRATIIASFRETLQQVIANPELIDARSAPARQRVMEQFTWDVKAQQVVEVYKWVLGQRADKPNWGMPFRESDDGNESSA